MKFGRSVLSTLVLGSNLTPPFPASEILIFALFVPSLAAVTICLPSFIFREGSKVVS